MKKIKLGSLLAYAAIAVLAFTWIMGEEMPGIIPETVLLIARYAAIAVLIASFLVDI